MWGLTLPPTTSGNALLDLPNEVLDNIVSHLNRPDLLTLRLVSQAIHNRTSSYTLQICYSVARVALWMPNSLSHARALLRHPQLKTWVDRLRFHVDRPTLAEGDNVPHCQNGCADDAALREEYVSYLEDTARQWEAGGTIAVAVTDILELYGARCAERNETTCIEIVGQQKEIESGDVDAVRPLRVLERRYGGLVSYHSKLDCSAEISLVLNGLGLAGLAPDYLIIGNNTMGIPVKMFRMPASGFTTMNPAFAHDFTLLWLNVQSTPIEADMDRRDEDVAHAADFWRAIGPRVRDLCWATQVNGLDSDKVRNIEYSNDLILARLCDDNSVAFPNLRNLTFRFPCFDRKRLVAFLARHRDTLKYIHVVHGHLKENIDDPEMRREAKGASVNWRNGFQEELSAAGLPQLRSADGLQWWPTEYIAEP